MPQIIVTADTTADARERPVMFRERVSSSDFESRHFQSQLVERLGWAVGDADAVERTGRMPGYAEDDAGELQPELGVSEVPEARDRLGDVQPVS